MCIQHYVLSCLSRHLKHKAENSRLKPATHGPILMADYVEPCVAERERGKFIPE